LLPLIFECRFYRHFLGLKRHFSADGRIGWIENSFLR
jgi:hypothetical protein